MNAQGTVRRVQTYARDTAVPAVPQTAVDPARALRAVRRPLRGTRGREAGAAGRRPAPARTTRYGLVSGAVPLALLVAGAVALRLLFPAWAAMWAIAFATFFGCKWLTWRAEAPAAARGSARLAATYLFGWAGMDPARFLATPLPSRDPRAAAWVAPILRALAGAALVWLVARQLARAAPLLAGWAGMVGLVLLLHFGVLDLIALAWRSRGFDAEPLMKSPARSASLSDFWSNRWNTAFNHLAGRYVFAPLSRRVGVAGATLATFLASGLVHDLVISLPARAGHGLPTAYFLIQGAAVLLDRAIGRGRTRRSPWRRLTAAAIVIAPLPLLFHEPFVRHVILPFLQATRAM
jgi:hypothetical protein